MNKPLNIYESPFGIALGDEISQAFKIIDNINVTEKFSMDNNDEFATFFKTEEIQYHHFDINTIGVITKNDIVIELTHNVPVKFDISKESQQIIKSLEKDYDCKIEDLGWGMFKADITKDIELNLIEKESDNNIVFGISLSKNLPDLNQSTITKVRVTARAKNAFKNLFENTTKNSEENTHLDNKSFKNKQRKSLPLGFELYKDLTSTQIDKSLIQTNDDFELVFTPQSSLRVFNLPLIQVIVLEEYPFLYDSPKPNKENLIINIEYQVEITKGVSDINKLYDRIKDTLGFEIENKSNNDDNYAASYSYDENSEIIIQWDKNETHASIVFTNKFYE